MNTREILEKVKNGELPVEKAQAYFSREPFEELGYAKLDTHREIRSGFPEVIYCSRKPDKYLVSIYQKVLEANGEVFGTRATEEQYELIRNVTPDIVYDPVSHILKKEDQDKKRIGKIAVCSAGTADIPYCRRTAARRLPDVPLP